jgi:hypothetical protein
MAVPASTIVKRLDVIEDIRLGEVTGFVDGFIDSFFLQATEEASCHCNPPGN